MTRLNRIEARITIPLRRQGSTEERNGIDEDAAGQRETLISAPEAERSGRRGPRSGRDAGRERMSRDAETTGESGSPSPGRVDVSESVPDEAIDEIAFLSRSPVRVRVLYILRRESHAERRELRERIDGVRTTVTRNLSALEDRGWIEHTSEGYAITSCGRMISDELIALTERVSLAVDLRPALRWLDVDRLDIGLREFERAEITTADATNPYAPVEEQIELFRRSERPRTALPTVNRQILRTCRRTAETDGSEAELIIEGDAVDRFRSEPRYADLFEEVCRECTVLRYDDAVPYYVGLSDETVQLGTTDGDGVTKVLLRFEDEPDVRSWANDRLARFEEAARPVE